MQFSRIYEFSLRVLLIFLPFSTLFSVFFREKLGIPGISFLKEGLLLVMILCLFVEHIRGKLRITWTRYDIMIGLYIFIFCSVTLFTTGLRGLIYGGRYDFAFLLIFFAVYHGFAFLIRPASYYIRLFLISGGIALFVSMLLKWLLSEDFLLYFGYSGNPSNWQFGSAVPIFHGVEGANVRRFQGIFDGPNTMGAYLLLYMGVFSYYFRYDQKWHFVIGCILFIFAGAIVYTYSRSALLGLFVSIFFIVIFSARRLLRLYPKQSISLFVVGILAVGAIGLQYGGSAQAILERNASSKGHRERMMIGVQKSLSHPLGLGLGSSGPAYRYVENLQNMDKEIVDRKDIENIPESWYIQQFVEGGFIGGTIFLLLMFQFLIGLSRKHILLGGMFISIGIMNFFLHTFESSMLSLSLFLVIGLILSESSRVQ